ncbi:DUF2786 domain-containing protein [Acaryochloris thomasi]|uniref:DUF2786 domain-containing protein n=1 Tax=Acaryochloris thomasi TaxID=2929456 RepID=UPI001314ACAA|nr:DUF2786 domain-containing protein [Acaryochloris thomasi]
MDIEERLRKLLTLSEQGAPGEAENAQRLLEKLLNKYDLALDQIEREASVDCTLTFRNRHERDLTIDVAWYVLKAGNHKYDKSKKNKYRFIGITPAQAVEMEFLYDHHRKELAKVLEAAATAYSVRNLPSPSFDGEKEQPVDELSDTEKIALEFYKAMPRSSPNRQLSEAGSAHAH